MKTAIILLSSILIFFISVDAIAQDKYRYDSELLTQKTDKEVMEMLRKANRKIESGKGSAMDFYNSGLVKFSYLNDTIGGLKDLEKSIELDNKAIGPFIGRARIREGKGDYNGALADLNVALTIDPNHVVIYNNRGYIYQLQGNYEAAIADYNKSILLETNLTEESARTYINKAETYKLMFKNKEAEDVYTELIKLFPNNVKSYTERAYFYRDVMVDYDKALKDYNKAVEVDKGSALILIERAKFKDDYSNDDKGAIEDCDLAIAKDPKYAMAYYMRSRPLYDMADYEGVIKACTEAVKYDTALYDAYVLRGNANDLSGKRAEALKDYEKAISLKPKDYRAYSELLTFYNKTKDYNSCIKGLNRFLNSGVVLPPNELRAYLAFLADLYFKVGDIPSGCATCKKAEALGSTEAEVLRVMNCQ